MAGQRGNTKVRIMDAAYGVFYREGFTRARVDVIADVL
jgi:AcrR family transcriptional regulator